MASIKEIATAASDIIFSNEGSYGSINRDDNGALSVGKLQWHAVAEDHRGNTADICTASR